MFRKLTIAVSSVLIFYLTACSAVQGTETFMEERVYKVEIGDAHTQIVVPPGLLRLIELNTYTRADYQEFRKKLNEQDILVRDGGEPIIQRYSFTSTEIDPEGKVFPEETYIEVNNHHPWVVVVDYYLEEVWTDAEGYAAFTCWDYSESKYIKVHEISAPGFVIDNTVRSFYIPDLRTQYYYLNPGEPGTEEVMHPVPHLIRQLWSNTASEGEKASVELIARGTAAIPELMADLKKHNYTSDGKYEFPDYPSNVAILEILKEIGKTNPQYLRKDDYIHLMGEAYHRGSSLTSRTLAASILRQIGGNQAQVLLREPGQTDRVAEVLFCPKCGRKMQSEWSYCPYDGTRLIQTPESR